MERKWYEKEYTICPNYDKDSGIIKSGYEDTCSKEAHSYADVRSKFGYRNMGDGRVLVQSWCENCRRRERQLNA